MNLVKYDFFYNFIPQYCKGLVGQVIVATNVLSSKVNVQDWVGQL